LPQLFAEYGYQPQLRVTSAFGATILNLVAAGLGVSIRLWSYRGSSWPGVRFSCPTIPLSSWWGAATTGRSAVRQHLLAAARHTLA
jgi:DNA-binding transcriptional LysR family regulator